MQLEDAAKALNIDFKYKTTGVDTAAEIIIEQKLFKEHN
jgi:hypothetical protein